MTKHDDEDGGRTFDQVLLDYRRGGLNMEITAAVNETTQAVLATGKTGKVTIELEITPNGLRMVNMRGLVKTKAPEADVEVGSYFVGRGGGLYRDDPTASKGAAVVSGAADRGEVG